MTPEQAHCHPGAGFLWNWVVGARVQMSEGRHSRCIVFSGIPEKRGGWSAFCRSRVDFRIDEHGATLHDTYKGADIGSLMMPRDGRRGQIPPYPPLGGGPVRQEVRTTLLLGEPYPFL